MTKWRNADDNKNSRTQPAAPLGKVYKTPVNVFQAPLSLYKKIEAHRQRPLISYVTSKRPGAWAQMSTDARPQIIEQIDALPEGSQALDFLIVSYGGDPMVAWRIITLIRERVDKVAVMIPQRAYSAATLVAFGAHEIVMHPNGQLGPVDMQITTGGAGQAKTFSTEDISAFLDFVRDNLKIIDQEHIRTLFELICKEVGSLVIGLTARSSKLAVDLGERLLALHMKDDVTRTKIASIVENMSRKFHLAESEGDLVKMYLIASLGALLLLLQTEHSRAVVANRRNRSTLQVGSLPASMNLRCFCQEHLGEIALRRD